ncbi:MAG: GNAT family N-acetyltransferase [Candidatus Cloacimonadaceae bacterium]|nr:GNAT family N-acetyltransferase [Candidatus Cloacimonadaceae bacterium]MDP3114189.1 GNAT family N-acetyltransferase [Candidatus Cloacimonadaceae bacterium]
MMSEIEIRIVKSAPAEEILALYRHPGWWQTDENPEYLETVRRIISDTFCFVIALDGEKVIGMGRAISDGVSDGYIQDVIVHSDYRGRGIGKDIIHALIKRMKESGLQWIGLISEPGYERFYQSLGFGIMQGYTPFLLKEDQ